MSELEFFEKLVEGTQYSIGNLSLSVLIMNPKDFVPFKFLILNGKILPFRFYPEQAMDEPDSCFDEFILMVNTFLKSKYLDLDSLRNCVIKQIGDSKVLSL